ncbi:MAG: hypothetical protein V4726_10560 [Verrucomicrobiota bacterium]
MQKIECISAFRVCCGHWSIISKDGHYPVRAGLRPGKNPPTGGVTATGCPRADRASGEKRILIEPSEAGHSFLNFALRKFTLESVDRFQFQRPERESRTFTGKIHLKTVQPLDLRKKPARKQFLSIVRRKLVPQAGQPDESVHEAAQYLRIRALNLTFDSHKI